MKYLAAIVFLLPMSLHAVQLAAPVNDTNWVTWQGTPVNSTGNRYQNIDETSASDTDYNYGPNNPNSSDVAEHAFASVSDPGIHTGHLVRFRYAQVDADIPVVDGGGTATTLSVELRQGATIIASTNVASAPSGTWQAGQLSVLSSEAANITDYGDLRVYFVPGGGGGSPANRRTVGISWAQLEVPDVTATRRRAHTTKMRKDNNGVLQIENKQRLLARRFVSYGGVGGVLGME